MFRKIPLLFTVLLLTISFLSCSDSIVNQPDIDNTAFEQTDSQSIEKGNSRSQYSVTRSINGNVGGTINLYAVHVSLFKIMTVNATLVIPPGAFQGTEEITMTADFSNASFYFSPSMIFDIPLSFDATYTGLDLFDLGLDTGDIIFAYIDDYGNIFPVENKRVRRNLLRGLLGVDKAVIEHFSRFGYSR